MIVDVGLFQLVQNVGSDMSNGEAGTDTTLFNKSQTGVITAIGSTDIALADKVSSKETINVTYLLSTALANGSDVSEYEVNNTTIAYNRIVKAALSKTAGDELTMLHTFDFKVIL